MFTDNVIILIMVRLFKLSISKGVFIKKMTGSDGGG